MDRLVLSVMLAACASMLVVANESTTATPTGTNAPGTTATGTNAPGTTPTGTNAPGTTPTGTNAPGATPTGTNAPGATPMTNAPGATPMTNAPGATPMTNAPGATHMTNAPGATPMTNAPGATHMTNAPGATPMTNAPGATPMTNAPGATHMTNAPGATPMTNAPGATHMTNAPGATHMTNAPGATPMTNAPGATHMTNAPGATPMTNAPGATPMTNAPGATPMTNAPGATPMTNAPGATHMTNAPGATPMTNAPGATHMTNAPGATTAMINVPGIEFVVDTDSTLNINREGCGTSKLCVADPSTCDPSESTSCFFVSVKQMQSTGQNFDFELAGESTGYIAVSLSTDTTAGGNDVTYICANNNSVIQFFSAFFDNGALTLTSLNANSVKGRLNGNQILCTFSATIPDSTATRRKRRATTKASSFSVGVSTGTVSGGTLGNPTSQVQSSVLNLAAPASPVTLVLSSSTATTAATPMTNAPGATHMTNAPGATPMTNAPGATHMTNAPGATPMTNAPGATPMTNAPGATPMTNAPGATPMTNAPGATHMTNAPGATHMTNAPGATPAMTNAPGTTPAMTNAPGTTPAMTNAPGVTTTVAANDDPVAPLVANTTVDTDSTLNINREGCGTSKLCVADPSTCDPSVSTSCFFVSVKQMQSTGQNFDFELAGESTGYIAVSLSTDTTAGGNDVTYICANNNSVIQFFSAFLDNGALTLTSLNANSVKGRLNGNQILCTFSATIPDSTATRRKRRDTTKASSFSVGVSTGTVRGGTLGNPTPKVQSSVLNLAAPASPVTLVLTSSTATTAAPVVATTSHAIPLCHSFSKVLLIILAVVGVSIL